MPDDVYGSVANKAWAKRTIQAINEEQINATAQASDPETTADETAWALSRLTDEGLDMLSTNLVNLTRREPYTKPLWQAVRMVYDALDGDVQREIARRQAKGDVNGQS